MPKFFIFLVLGIFSQSALANLTCQSIGVASCMTNVGFCVEYIPSSGDVSQLEQYCLKVNGIFNEAPCDESFKVGTCINESNNGAPIIRFDTHLDPEISKRLCISMNGMFCSN